MADNTTRKRVAAHAERMREKGFKRVCVWVPEAAADALRKYAEKLRTKTTK